MNRNWLKIENISTSNTKTNMEHQLWQQEQVSEGRFKHFIGGSPLGFFFDCIAEAGWFDRWAQYGPVD